MAASWATIVRGNAAATPPPAGASPAHATAGDAPPAEGSTPPPDASGVTSHATAPQEWRDEQQRLATAVVLDDAAAGFVMPWDEKSAPALPGAAPAAAERPPGALRFVGGLDISFVKDTNVAVASLAILEYPSLKLLHTEMHHCTMDLPYIPGYLAFREVAPLKTVLASAKAKWPAEFPQIFFVDGNGVLHYRRCGLATHLGVVEDIVTVGCAKNLLNVDGLARDNVTAGFVERAKTAKKGDPTAVMPLVGRSGALWGYAALTGNSTTKPVYISAGHRISPEAATRLALSMAPYRVIEPVRQADLRSRDYVRETFGA